MSMWPIAFSDISEILYFTFINSSSGSSGHTSRGWKASCWCRPVFLHPYCVSWKVPAVFFVSPLFPKTHCIFFLPLRMTHALQYPASGFSAKHGCPSVFHSIGWLSVHFFRFAQNCILSIRPHAQFRTELCDFTVKWQTNHDTNCSVFVYWFFLR